MEKPVTVDGPTTRRCFTLAEESVKKNLKVGVGLMIRHCRAGRNSRSGSRTAQIGEIIALRAYRMHGPVGRLLSAPNPRTMSELLYPDPAVSQLPVGQRRRLQRLAHPPDRRMLLDEGRLAGLRPGHRRPALTAATTIDQNFDNYAVEYTFPDGTKLFFYSRGMNGCYEEIASYAHGTKGLGVIDNSGHFPGKCRIYKGHNLAKQDLVWAFPQPEPIPYQTEWDDLLEAIRQDKPYNEAKRGTEASLVTSMGRMAAHTGRVVTFDEMLQHDARVRPRRGQADHGFACPLAGRSRRQVSRSAAGYYYAAGVLMAPIIQQETYHDEETY